MSFCLFWTDLVEPEVDLGLEVTGSAIDGDIKMAEEPKIELFLKASSDAESVGHCPFGQRLFMILWLKGVNFTLTTVDMKRAPDVLKSLAPGSQPPFLIYNGELKTDINKIEEFLEEKLAPPYYQKMCCCYNESKTIGDDIFRTFSAYIKIAKQGLHEHLEKKFLRSLTKLDDYLLTPLPCEQNMGESTRPFLDGYTLTLADCSLLPKLNIVEVVCKKYRDFDIKTLKGIARYLEKAHERQEFHHTCPRDAEILHAYSTVATSWHK